MFGFGKKKEQQETAQCACSCTSGGEAAGVSAAKSTEEICCIKVLGAGCRSCHEMYENAKKAVAELGLGIEVEYITDMEQVMAYGVMSMPALVVNEKVVSMGKVLKPEDILKLIR